MNNIEIYTSSTCGYCHKAKEFFDENKIEYVEHNISTDTEARKTLMKMGYRSVPVIIIGKEKILGFDKDRILNILGL